MCACVCVYICMYIYVRKDVYMCVYISLAIIFLNINQPVVGVLKYQTTFQLEKMLRMKTNLG